MTPPDFSMSDCHLKKRILSISILSLKLMCLFTLSISGVNAHNTNIKTEHINLNQNVELTTTNYIKSEEGCYVYNRPQTFGNRVEWQGDCVEGYAEGEGVAKWYNENKVVSIYTGNFKHGKLEGEGRIDWKINSKCDLDYYEGQLKDSAPFNQGALHFTDGNVYKGEFVPDGVLARGVKIWGEDSAYAGDRYEGEFLNMKMHGQGTYTWGENRPWSGDKYVGEYRNNNRNGYGVYTESNGDKYSGQWLKGVRSGYGEMIYANGIVYKGFWKDNDPNGYGKFIYTNGNVYEGNVLHAKRHGKGKTTFKSGNVFQGEYRNGKRHGAMTVHRSNGNVAHVIFENGEIISGSEVRPNGIKYDGSWRGFKAWGYGKLTAPREAFNPTKRAKNGVWQGDTYVEKGWFYDNKFKFPCDNEQHCKQVASQNPAWQKFIE